MRAITFMRRFRWCTLRLRREAFPDVDNALLRTMQGGADMNEFDAVANQLWTQS